MRIIGLTGGIACGKTTVAGWLKALGAAVIDADEISHELTGPGGQALPAIFQAFGQGVKNFDGTLNRKALGDLVFGDEAQRQRLNRILHPLVKARMAEETECCRKMGVSTVIWDVPLLYEAGMAGMTDQVWCVSAPRELQIARLKERDGLSREEAEARLGSQWPLSQKESRADAVIRTDRPIQEVRAEVEDLYERSQRC